MGRRMINQRIEYCVSLLCRSQIGNLKKIIILISFFGAAVSVVPLILLTTNKGVMGESVNLLALWYSLTAPHSPAA
jgi:hypothetical protein